MISIENRKSSVTERFLFLKRKRSAKKALRSEGIVQGLAQQSECLYNSPSGLNRKIEAIYHSEGRYFNTSATTTPSFRIEYTISDHLGNARISFTDKNLNGKIDVDNTTNNEILQENHYYAFGLGHNSPWLMTEPTVPCEFVNRKKDQTLSHEEIQR
jgi:hypothetical protein